LWKKVAGNVGYYPTLPSRIKECQEIAKEDNNMVKFLQWNSGNWLNSTSTHYTFVIKKPLYAAVNAPIW